MMVFYDFEVFERDWLGVFINPIEHTETVIVNDRDKLQEYYDRNVNSIWIGYNSRRYDQYILKGILCGFDPKKINDYIIVEDKKGWQFSPLLKKIPLINFDVILKNDGGLKSLEGFMGNSIEETSVPFNIDRKLTPAEIAETVKYCRHDVEQTIEVFLARKEEFDAHMGLIKIFKRPLSDLNKTKAQLVAAICGAKFQKFDDEFEFPIVDTLRLSKYKYIADWYLKPENHDYKKSQKVTVAGVPHVFAWGGIHGAIPKYCGTGIYILADVNAYYPSLQIRYKFGYRNMANPENFEHIHSENLRLKKIDKKARLPYKIADNSMSGQLKDKFSGLYDPRDNNAICVNGQLLLLDLIEKLEPHCQLIQSNTDGILFKIPSMDVFDTIDDIVWEWEQRTGMRMEFDFFNKVYQKDVNNYLLVGSDGKIKSKGAYTKSLGPLDYDLPIINKAMAEFMVNGTPVEVTIGQCDELKMFQKIVKVTGNYWKAWHNGEYLNEKTHRVFASLNARDTYVGKCKREGATIEKFANTPDHCFVVNGNVNGLKVPSNLNKEWYMDLAKERLTQFGVK